MLRIYGNFLIDCQPKLWLLLLSLILGATPQINASQPVKDAPPKNTEEPKKTDQTKGSAEPKKTEELKKVIELKNAGGRKKAAFLIGVSKYDKAGLNNLAYAEDDMTALNQSLTTSGFETEILLGSGQGENRATRANIKNRLETRFAESIKKLNKSDVVLIAISGHGQQLDIDKAGARVEDHFFCPVDAIKTDPATLVSVSELIELVGRNSGAENNLFIIDACRDNPAKGGKGIDGSRISLPRNMAAIFGSTAGKQSYESDKLKHGLLTYYLLEGLNGRAKDEDNEITWDSLVNYTKKQVTRNAPELVGTDQTPNSISNVSGTPVLARVGLVKIDGAGPAPIDNHMPGEVRDDNELKMKLAYCPAGKFVMGSPTNDPNYSEDESSVDVKLTKPFWLGRYAVTQAEWRQVMKSEPWKGKTFVQDGTYFPATYMSWNDAREFCKKLTDSERKAGRLTNAQKFDLPTEAQWEYACRAGTKTPYFFGNDAATLGNYAWFVGNTSAKTTPAQQYAHSIGQKDPNPWKLYDMSGNVWQWCLDGYDDLPGGDDPLIETGKDRVFRGGSWNDTAVKCRTAYRGRNDVSNKISSVGFRVALVSSN